MGPLVTGLEGGTGGPAAHHGLLCLVGLCIRPLGPPYISLLLSTLTVFVPRVEH